MQQPASDRAADQRGDRGADIALKPDVFVPHREAVPREHELMASVSVGFVSRRVVRRERAA
jgi:hypothetical protein